MFGDFDEKLFNLGNETNDGKQEENKSFELESYAEYIASKDKKQKKQTTKPNESADDLLKIIKFDTDKSKIKLRPLQEQKIIPAHPFRLLLVGRSGSGKSMTLCNLMTRKHMYGMTKPNDKKSNYFNLVWLFSPTAECDDLARHLDLDEQKIITNEVLFVPVLDHILNTQKELIAKTNDISKVPRICIIMDDIQSCEKFLRTPTFTSIYIAGRHYNISVICCCQSWTRMPRVCRLQASNIMLYPSSASELNLLADEYTPPNATKAQFMDLIKHATNEPYSFLHINNQTKISDRYRKNLDVVLNIN